jgi:ABC-2 type transport system permease protein
MNNSFRRIGSLVVKEFIHLFRDLIFLPMILLGPVTELTAVAYATGAEIRNLPLAIVDQDRSAESREIAALLDNTTTFELTLPDADFDDVTGLLDHNDAVAVLIIPPGFSAGLTDSTQRPQLQLLLNGAESSAAEVALETTEGVIARYGIDLMTERIGVNDAMPEPSARVWFNEELREANYTIPSELGFMLYMVALMVASLGISRERELGTLEQLLVTPVSKMELLIGKAVPAVIIAYINFLLMLAMSVFLFHVPMRGSLALLMVLAFFYILVELGRGFIISVLSRTQHQALLLVFVLAMVDMIFSGYAVPVESMPRAFQIGSLFFPIRHWMIIMRGIMLKGSGIAMFWPQVLAIVGLGIVIVVVTLLSFQRALD